MSETTTIYIYIYRSSSTYTVDRTTGMFGSPPEKLDPATSVYLNTKQAGYLPGRIQPGCDSMEIRPFWLRHWKMCNIFSPFRLWRLSTNFKQKSIEVNMSEFGCFGRTRDKKNLNLNIYILYRISRQYFLFTKYFFYLHTQQNNLI